MGTRFNANTYEPTSLQFTLSKNGAPSPALIRNKVTIHATLDDATANLNILQTIPSGSITSTGVGLYEYTAAVRATAGVYYDKIFLTPEAGMGEISFINSFEVSLFTGYTGDIPYNPGSCIVYGTILDGYGQGLPNVLVLAAPATVPATLEGGNKLIAPAICETATTSTGYFELTLVRNIDFIVTIKEIGYKERIRVPNQASIQLWSMSPLPEVDATPNDSNEKTW